MIIVEIAKNVTMLGVVTSQKIISKLGMEITTAVPLWIANAVFTIVRIVGIADSMLGVGSA